MTPRAVDFPAPRPSRKRLKLGPHPECLAVLLEDILPDREPVCFEDSQASEEEALQDTGSE